MGLFAAGSRITADKLNGRTLLLRQQTGAVIPNNVETKLAWSTVERNDGFDFLAGGDTVVIPFDGIYVVSACVRYATNATGHRRISLYLNSTLYADQATPAISSTQTPVSASFQMEMFAGNTIDCRVTQSSGGNLGIAATSRTPNLIVCKIA